VATAELDHHIRGQLPKRLKDPRLGKDAAIRVLSADGSDVLFSSQAGEAQMPASNMKLVTAFGVLSTMGPQARFPTLVTTRAQGKGVVLVGGGDPLLSADGLDTLAARTVSGLRAGDGSLPKRVKLFVDDRLFGSPTLAEGWPRSYVPGEVTFVRALGRHGVHVLDTSKEAAASFASRLRARGLAVTVKGRGGGALGNEVARIDGHTVAAAVSVMLTYSDNQVAETLFRHVAVATGHKATWAGGQAAALEVLQDAGISTKRLRLLDGSGLSRADRLTARTASQILERVQSGAHPELTGFLGWLPVAGRTGTLAPYTSRYVTRPSSCAAGLVHAKTGTLTGALGLSGVAVGRDGRTRVFSIIVNHLPTRRYSVLSIRRAMDGLAATVTGCW
jgi:serine-type D-Ala-D-Ala carboxypeptidase/endopeptidase (penicillin-binding protein 4)